MAVDVVLTKRIQNAIVEATKCDHISDDLAEQLSKYTKECSSEKRLGCVENEVVIPFKLVKQLWECLRGKEAGTEAFNEASNPDIVKCQGTGKCFHMTGSLQTTPVNTLMMYS